MLIPAIVFLVAIALILGAYWAFVLNPENRNAAALRQRMKPEDRRLERSSSLLREPETLSGIAALNNLLTRYSLSAAIKQAIDNSGLPLTVSMVVLGSVSIFCLVLILINTYIGVWWLALFGGLLSLLIPVFVVRIATTRRVRKFEEQFPEAVELIGRALRAGHAFATGLQMVAEEMPKPAGPEFRLLHDRQNYGAQLPDALRSFAQRIPSLDARFFVTAVLTQREAGGNLSEVLDRLASVMRERFRIRREVRVRSAHGRMTAGVLASMPPALALLTFINSPDQAKLMMTDPLGIKMLIVGGVLEVLGILVIRKLIDIEY